MESYIYTDTIKEKLKKIKEIKPILQKENAIWGINAYKNKVLVNFADGYILKLV
jgi:hypothetical protein